jgi:hypothetical protein
VIRPLRRVLAVADDKRLAGVFAENVVKLLFREKAVDVWPNVVFCGDEAKEAGGCCGFESSPFCQK